jgi:5-methyltetrahydropteroyltriglutamate--homocysteine methyltransferase
MPLSAVHGFPRIGPNRELKFALEGHWRGEVSAGELQETARGIRRANWELMRDAGIDLIPSNDFSLYDQVLDTAQLVGVVPPGLDAYFAAARGSADTPALEMTKWFDTNYHYIVPELVPGT